MSQQWIRVVKLDIGGTEYTLDELDIEFDVPFGDSEEPDIAEITIWNLNNDSVANLKDGTPVNLSAGYKNDNSISNLLTGKVESPETNWQGVDKKTTFKVSDGGKEWRNTNYTMTYQAGTRASIIMRDLINKMGLEIAVLEPVNDIEYVRGKSIHGPARNSLKQLVNDTNSKMRITKEKVYIHGHNATIGDVIVLNSDTGLIGTPEKQEEEDEEGNVTISYSFTCLLNPLINKDTKVLINSRSINGLFRVTKGRHDGSQFNTEANCVPI